MSLGKPTAKKEISGPQGAPVQIENVHQILIDNIAKLDKHRKLQAEQEAQQEQVIEGVSKVARDNR